MNKKNRDKEPNSFKSFKDLTPRVRFAPSPTGYLHVGNARTALFNWLFARQKKGTSILRVEDTDVERSQDKYEKKLREDLQWLGLAWDEGPESGGEYGPYRQSSRLDIYKKYTQKLLKNKRAYYCFCSKEELAKERETALAAGKMPIYSGKCRTIPPDKARERIKAGEEAVVRLKTPGKGSLEFNDLIRGELSFKLNLFGDPILVRPNGLPAYNYAVVIDDHLMQISHVIRGEDHIANTVRQILTYRALDFPLPQFAHVSMVMGEDNTRLSKRHGATAVDQFNKDGILPSALFNYLALLGWSPPEGKEVLTQDEIIELFDIKKVSRSAAIFDYEKLYWLNRQHIKKLSPREKAEMAAPHLYKAGLLPDEMSKSLWKWLEQAVDVLIERVNKFADFPAAFSMLFDFAIDKMGAEEKEILQTECGRKVTLALEERLLAEAEFSYDALSRISGDIKTETGCKGKDLFHPIRVALTGKISGLALDKFILLVESGAGLDFPTPLKTRVSEIIKKIYGF